MSQTTNTSEYFSITVEESPPQDCSKCPWTESFRFWLNDDEDLYEDTDGEPIEA